MEYTPSVARAAWAAALASSSSSAKISLSFERARPYWTRCCCCASCSRCCCSSSRWRCCSCSCCGKNTLATVMFTSVTRRPMRLSTRLITLRLTASASWGMDLPYSAVSVRSMADSSWPTSTETPCVWLPPPPVMEPRMPPTACEAPLPILLPSTSWDAIPATFDTTLSEMLVLPRSVCSGLLLLLWSVMCPSPFVLRALYRPAREQPVDGEQDDGAQRGRQYGLEAEAPRAPAEAEPSEHPSADKGAH